MKMYYFIWKESEWALYEQVSSSQYMCIQSNMDYINSYSIHSQHLLEWAVKNNWNQMLYPNLDSVLRDRFKQML